jgi:hypothetical protein
MAAYELWALYVGALLGTRVENAQEKFEALDLNEQAAWATVGVALSTGMIPGEE